MKAQPRITVFATAVFAPASCVAFGQGKGNGKGHVAFSISSFNNSCGERSHDERSSNIEADGC
jgi:hypothetical protein